MRATADDYPCRVVNRRTGEDIPWCVWADDVAGEAECLVMDRAGIGEINPDTGELRTILLTGLDLCLIPLEPRRHEPQ